MPLPTPEPPQLLAGEEASRTTDSLQLGWPPVSGAQGYDLEVTAAGGGAVVVAAAPGDTVGGLLPETNYALRVRARAGSELSDWSAPPTVTCTRPAPPPPPGVTRNDMLETGVTLGWALPPRPGPVVELGRVEPVSGQVQVVHTGTTADTFIEPASPPLAAYRLRYALPNPVLASGVNRSDWGGVLEVTKSVFARLATPATRPEIPRAYQALVRHIGLPGGRHG